MRLYSGHLGRKDAGGAVERGEGLVEHRHVAADGRLALHEIDVLAGVGQGERGVDAGDTPSHDQNVGIDGDPLTLQRAGAGELAARRRG